MRYLNVQNYVVRGKALVVYLLARNRADMAKDATVTLPAHELAGIGVTTRSAKKRALAALEDAGLVAVERANGRTARVTVLDWP